MCVCRYCRRNNDGLLDVLGIRTLFQLGMAVSSHVALAGGINRVGQGEHIHFDFVQQSSSKPTTVPVQVSGNLCLGVWGAPRLVDERFAFRVVATGGR